ncbi:surface antigen [Parvibaculum indicum]|uniref:RT0821/Lpp0805 family surface protein n=1 Tax=Parvibaculum indicum TaxID=562969 RepID=UPI001423BDAF|nr:RT0821/Lpp0805 family surface protein [Parvibaculum indicum]NIJ41910.1 surface antigen [Parvibaculum indicum]
MTFSRVTKMATAVALVLGMSAASTMANAGPRYSYDQYNNRYDQQRYDNRYDSRYDYGNRGGSYYGNDGNDRGKDMLGAIGGALIGGLIGSQFGGGDGKLFTTGAGVLVGAMLGQNIAGNLDRRDRPYVERASYDALAGGRRTQWRNPDSGNYGYVTPAASYERAGRHCREYEQTIYINNRARNAHGTACRMRDGSWQIVN